MNDDTISGRKLPYRDLKPGHRTCDRCGITHGSRDHRVCEDCRLVLSYKPRKRK